MKKRVWQHFLPDTLRRSLITMALVAVGAFVYLAAAVFLLYIIRSPGWISDPTVSFDEANAIVDRYTRKYFVDLAKTLSGPFDIAVPAIAALLATLFASIVVPVNDANPERWKIANVRDAAASSALLASGLAVAWITGATVAYTLSPAPYPDALGTAWVLLVPIIGLGLGCGVFAGGGGFDYQEMRAHARLTEIGVRIASLGKLQPSDRGIALQWALVVGQVIAVPIAQIATLSVIFGEAPIPRNFSELVYVLALVAVLSAPTVFLVGVAYSLRSRYPRWKRSASTAGWVALWASSLFYILLIFERNSAALEGLGEERPFVLPIEICVVLGPIVGFLMLMYLRFGRIGNPIANLSYRRLLKHHHATGTSLEEIAQGRVAAARQRLRDRADVLLTEGQSRKHLGLSRRRFNEFVTSQQIHRLHFEGTTRFSKNELDLKTQIAVTHN